MQGMTGKKAETLETEKGGVGLGQRVGEERRVEEAPPFLPCEEASSINSGSLHNPVAAFPFGVPFSASGLNTSVTESACGDQP